MFLIHIFLFMKIFLTLHVWNDCPLQAHCTSIKNYEGKQHFKRLNFILNYLKLIVNFVYIRSKRRQEDMFSLDQSTNLFIQTKYIRHQFANILPF